MRWLPNGISVLRILLVALLSVSSGTLYLVDWSRRALQHERAG